VKTRVDETFRELIPPLRPEEFAALKSSILEEGCRDPLTIWNDVIVDGHNRYEICTEQGIPFEVRHRDFEDEAAAKEWMLGNQLARRNLSEVDRIELNLAREDLRARRGRLPNNQKTYPDGYVFDHANTTNGRVAKAAGTTREKVRKHQRIKASEEMGPGLLDAIREGKETYTGAERKVKSLEEKKAKARRRLAAADKVAALTFDERLMLKHGDFYDVLEELPDGTVDVIVTDPPYALEYLELWNKLGEVAFRLLKDGGFLFAYAGNEKVFNKHARLEASGLIEFCQLYIPQLKRKWLGRRQTGLKPVLGLSKGAPGPHEVFFDLVPVSGVDKNSKEHHPWGQPLEDARYLVKRFSEPGDLIVDPMCGSGTIPIAAYLERRRGLGCEIDRDHYLEAKRKIVEMAYSPNDGE
jgi:DNA methylase